MNERDSIKSDLVDSLLIDRLCDTFESQSQQGQKPQIREFLREVEPRLSTQLFEQLLSLELEFASSKPALADYLTRFPEYEPLVRSVFEELDLMDWKGQSIGSFIIDEQIARGGMGVIYLATDTRLDRRVAIKLLPRERRDNTKWLRRFRREAKLASALSHPNIVTIYEIGDENGTPYIVSEFVDGVTIRTRMAAKRLTVAEAVQFATQIADGMKAAHRAGVIHRDLKADNVMVREDGLVKILDFGLAKPEVTRASADSQITKTGSISGTAPYMSPEQARGQELTTQTDVFSFGVLLYSMIEGKLPFRGETPNDVIAKILHQTPDRFNDERKPPPELTNLIFHCLDKEASKRPAFDQIGIQLSELKLTTRHKKLEPQPSIESDSQRIEILSDDKTLGTDHASGTVTKYDLRPSSIRYAQSHDINIAWQEIGSGPIDIVFVMGWISHLEYFWKDASFSSFLRKLATFARVILFDKRGTGLSDRVPVNELPDLETRMDDVRAVMDAANSKRAVLCGVSEGGPLCALFAATYPEKTVALTMIGSYSRRLWAPDYPWGPTLERREDFFDEIAANWGGPLGLEDRAPSKAEDPEFREWWSSYLRMGASPGAAVALTKMNAQIDIRRVLPSIQVPTLVIHRTGDRCLLVEEGRYLAEGIPNAKFVELPGDDHLPFVGDSKSILDEIESFLTRLNSSAEFDSVLATVLRIEAASNEDNQLVRDFTSWVANEIDRLRGKSLVANDGIWVAAFDGPVRSIVCAQAVLMRAAQEGIEAKCGLETGICKIDPAVVSGPAIEGARLVCELAEPGSIIVTENLRNLISGSQLEFKLLDHGLEHGSVKSQLFSVSY